jgi:peroxiredoxin
VRDALPQFGDATIAVVTFADAARLASFRQHLNVPFAVLCDPDLRIYRLVGAGRGRVRDIYSLSGLWKYAKRLRAGAKFEKPTEDVRQLGADIVIDRDGRVVYLSVPPTPEDRPPVTDLIAACR